MFLPLTFSSLMSRSEQKVAVLPGSKNAQVFSILLPFIALICTGTISKTQSGTPAPIWSSLFLGVCTLIRDIFPLNGCGGR